MADQLRRAATSIPLSKDGISHNESESATPEDLAAGCDVLLRAILSAAEA